MVPRNRLLSRRRASMPRPPALLLAPLLLLAACDSQPVQRLVDVVSPTIQQHGARVDPEQLHELVPGTSTKADVTSLIGSPTARATFDDNTWIYIAERTYNRIGRLPGVDKQDVVVLNFDQGGVLRSVRKLNKDNAQPVSVATATTPSPGTEASFIQQLLGNVGRYNPGGSGLGSTGAGSSAGAASFTQ